MTNLKMKFLRKLTKFEKIYIVLFIGSLIAGVVNGIIDIDYFACCEESIGVPEEGTSILKIFKSNFLLSLTEMFTAGLSSLYYNFHTFSLTASYLNSQNSLYTLPIIFLVGLFELAGSLFIALTGLIFVEKFFRIKSKFNYKPMFFYGVALIFVGAVIEYTLLRAVI